MRVSTAVADEDKKSNATYIISVARKLGCSIFLLPEDIIEVIYSFKDTFADACCFFKKFNVAKYWFDFKQPVPCTPLSGRNLTTLFNKVSFCNIFRNQQVKQKMILTLLASIMYWSLNQRGRARPSSKEFESDTQTASLVYEDSDCDNNRIDNASGEMQESEEPNKRMLKEQHWHICKKDKNKTEIVYSLFCDYFGEIYILVCSSGYMLQKQSPLILNFFSNVNLV